MFKKKLFSIVLAMVMTLGIVATPASAASGSYELKINTNNKGTVSITSGNYKAGEVLIGIVTPDDGYEIKKINASKGAVEWIDSYSFRYVRATSLMKAPTS